MPALVIVRHLPEFHDFRPGDDVTTRTEQRRALLDETTKGTRG